MDHDLLRLGNTLADAADALMKSENRIAELLKEAIVSDIKNENLLLEASDHTEIWKALSKAIFEFRNYTNK